jgi:hypothetical protein
MTQYDERDPKVDELTSVLLRSLCQDVAPSHAKRATLVALGVGVATTTAAGSASALVGAARVGVAAMAKAVVCGALVGAVVVGTSTYVQRRASAPPSTVQARMASAPHSDGPRKTETPAAAPPIGATEKTTSRVDEGSPLALHDSLGGEERSRHESTGRRVNLPVPSLPIDAPPAPEVDLRPIAKPSALAREIALLDGSRSALSANDATEALRLLDRYAREFETGSLWPEAVVLRIDSLLRKGDAQAARLLAAQFEQSRPNDSHLLRIRSLFSQAKVSPPPDRAPSGR